MKKNILVTGGAGYIGSVLVRLLINDGFNVLVLDNLMFGGETLLGVWHSSNFKLIKGDIASKETLNKVFSNHGIDSVVHLAGIVGDPACAKQPELANTVNWDASCDLLDVSMENSVERFVFASTCSNYGKMADNDRYVVETSQLAPISLYAELKVKFENVILNEIKKSGSFCPTSLRFSTVYGISPKMRFDLTINEFTKELNLGRELEIFGEQFWRPYCHVYDLASAILLVLKTEKDKVAYNTFNVGETSENYTKKMIIEEIVKVIPDAKIKYVHKDDDPRDYKVSFEKIKKELGFCLTRKVPDGIMEIKKLLDENVLLNPDDQKYRNC